MMAIYPSLYSGTCIPTKGEGQKWSCFFISPTHSSLGILPKSYVICYLLCFRTIKKVSIRFLYIELGCVISFSNPYPAKHPSGEQL